MRLAKDVIQHISQYSAEVYCKLRCLNHELKDMVDEVLPYITEKIDHSEKKRRRMYAMDEYLARCNRCCGMILLQQKLFQDWIDAMMNNAKYGESVELFCRNSLPRNGYFHRSALKLLCKFNRTEYVRELWNETIDRKSRFTSDCIVSICMLDDLELLKTVHKSFADDEWSTNMTKDAACMAIDYKRWKNVLYLLRKYPETNFNHRKFDQKLVKENIYSFENLVTRPKDKRNTIEILQHVGMFLRSINHSKKTEK